MEFCHLFFKFEFKDAISWRTYRVKPVGVKFALLNEVEPLKIEQFATVAVLVFYVNGAAVLVFVLERFQFLNVSTYMSKVRSHVRVYVWNLVVAKAKILNVK